MDIHVYMYMHQPGQQTTKPPWCLQLQQVLGIWGAGQAKAMGICSYPRTHAHSPTSAGSAAVTRDWQPNTQLLQAVIALQESAHKG